MSGSVAPLTPSLAIPIKMLRSLIGPHRRAASNMAQFQLRLMALPAPHTPRSLHEALEYALRQTRCLEDWTLTTCPGANEVVATVLVQRRHAGVRTDNLFAVWARVLASVIKSNEGDITIRRALWAPVGQRGAQLWADARFCVAHAVEPLPPGCLRSTLRLPLAPRA